MERFVRARHVTGPYSPDSDRSLEEPARTVGDELQREAATIGSAMQLFLRLRWWLAAVSAIGVVAWKAAPAASTATAAPALEARVDAIDRNVRTLVKIACLQYGPTSIEITMSDLSCPAPTAADHTAAPPARSRR